MKNITYDSMLNPVDMSGVVKAKIISLDDSQVYDDYDRRLNGDKNIECAHARYTDYIEKWNKLIDKGNVYHLSCSSGCWPTYYDAAVEASKYFRNHKNRVYVMDTKLGGAGGSLLLDSAFDIVNNHKKEPIGGISRRIVCCELIDNYGYVFYDGIMKNISDLFSLKYRLDYDSVYNGELIFNYLKFNLCRSDLSFVKRFLSSDNIEKYERSRFAICSDKDVSEIVKYVEGLGYFYKIIVSKPSYAYNDRIKDRYFSIAVVKKNFADKILKK